MNILPDELIAGLGRRRILRRRPAAAQNNAQNRRA
jgi:hypothetical protein